MVAGLDDGPSWRARGSKTSEPKLVDVSKNFSGYYTKDELLSIYSPYLRPPAGFLFCEKVTSRTPLPPVSLSPTQAEEGEEVS